MTLEDVTSILPIPTYQHPACPAALHCTHSHLTKVFLTVPCCGGLVPHTHPAPRRGLAAGRKGQKPSREFLAGLG